MPIFEWDDAKNDSNVAKHGISFEEASSIFDGPVLTSISHGDFGEIRSISFGTLNRVVVVAVVHTDRQNKVRIISARKAKEKERKLYYAYLRSAFGTD